MLKPRLTRKLLISFGSLPDVQDFGSTSIPVIESCCRFDALLQNRPESDAVFVDGNGLSILLNSSLRHWIADAQA
jgi:hypothetical protein